MVSWHHDFLIIWIFWQFHPTLCKHYNISYNLKCYSMMSKKLNQNRRGRMTVNLRWNYEVKVQYLKGLVYYTSFLNESNFGATGNARCCGARLLHQFREAIWVSNLVRKGKYSMQDFCSIFRRCTYFLGRVRDQICYLNPFYMHVGTCYLTGGESSCLTRLSLYKILKCIPF